VVWEARGGGGGGKRGGGGGGGGGAVKLTWGAVWNVPIVGLVLLGFVVGLGLYILFGPYAARANYDAVSFFLGSAVTCRSTGEYLHFSFF